MSQPSRKKRRVSKHKKSSQRQLDISSELTGLQDVQDEIRQHGQLLSTKPDDALFVLDTSKMDTSDIDNQVKLSKKQKARSKTNMVDRILNPYTKVVPVRAPRSKSNKAEQIAQKRTDRKDSSSLAASRKRASTIMSTNTTVYDIWDEKISKPIMEANLPKKVDGYGMGFGTKKYFKSPTLLVSHNTGTDIKMKNPSALDEVKLQVHPGQSYKPTKVDHQNLLRSEHKKLTNAKERQDKIARKVAWDIETAATQADLKAELESGLFDEDDDWVSEDEEPKEPPASTENVPKSAKAKKNVKEEQLRLKKLRAKKEQRHQESQVYNAKRILKLALLDEKQILVNKKIRDERKSKVAPRLGLAKYEEADKPLKLSDEMKPTLRELVTEGHILKDRYESLVKRGVIEPHMEHRKKYMRKYKTKLKVKRSVRRALGETIG